MSESISVPETGSATLRPRDLPGGVVAVLSQHAYLALQMRRAGFDILEGKDIDDLAKASTSVDVVVVDLVAVDGRRGVVARLSTAVDPRIPVVLISADEIDVALLGSGRAVHIVVPPVRAEDVITRVRDILTSRALDAASAAEPAPAKPTGRVAAKVGLRPGPRAAKAAAKRAQAGETSGTVTEIRDHKKLPPRRTPTRRIDEAAGGPRPTELPPPGSQPSQAVPIPPQPPQPPRPAAAKVASVPMAAAKAPAGPPAAGRASAAVATATKPTAAPAHHAAPNGAAAANGTTAPTVVDLTALPAPVLDWRIIANQLTQAVQSIPAVAVVAQTMANELAAASGAHVAVMVRDDSGRWQVEAGVGLRSFEWAQTLQDDDWLVWAGRDQHPSLMVMDTDVVRGDLTGAPLASRLQLVRTHSTKAPFFVCAGWESDDGNDTGRVALVVEAVRRHSQAMADALGVRSFAEWLCAHVDGGEAVLPG